WAGEGRDGARGKQTTSPLARVRGRRMLLLRPSPPPRPTGTATGPPCPAKPPLALRARREVEVDSHGATRRRRRDMAGFDAPSSPIQMTRLHLLKKELGLWLLLASSCSRQLEPCRCRAAGDHLIDVTLDPCV
uniref:Uncharacterized protein n=1 Tax=Aegilops tauschii subsp. strangulata TaxID=200361 RepID=A0A453QG26_AEGTS